MDGIGVMLATLSGNAESVAVARSAIGKTITGLALKDDSLKFEFSDGTKMSVFDDGQSCCEKRYMVTADDLSTYVGGVLLDMEIKDAPDMVDPDGEAHEVQFLDVKTSKGVFQMASHNEHNGYYGGFAIRCREDL